MFKAPKGKERDDPVFHYLYLWNSFYIGEPWLVGIVRDFRALYSGSNPAVTNDNCTKLLCGNVRSKLRLSGKEDWIPNIETLNQKTKTLSGPWRCAAGLVRRHSPEGSYHDPVDIRDWRVWHGSGSYQHHCVSVGRVRPFPGPHGGGGLHHWQDGVYRGTWICQRMEAPYAVRTLKSISSKKAGHCMLKCGR